MDDEPHLSKPPNWREWAHLTGPDIDALDRDRTVVVVTASPLEVHGPHLPTLADIGQAEGLLVRTAENLGEAEPGLVFVHLPPLMVAADVLPHVGSLRFSPSTVRLVLRELGETLARQGFRHVWVSSFHGGPRHILALEQAADDVWRSTGCGMVSVFSLLATRLTGGSSDLAARLAGIGGITADQLRGDAHGGLIETSMLLHLVPALVRDVYRTLPRLTPDLDLAADGRAPLQRGDKPTLPEILRSLPLRQRYYERRTYAGNPSLGSAALGADYVELLASEATKALRELLRGDLTPADCHSPLWPMRHLLMSDRIGALFDRVVRTKRSPV